MNLFRDTYIELLKKYLKKTKNKTLKVYIQAQHLLLTKKVLIIKQEINI